MNQLKTYLLTDTESELVGVLSKEASTDVCISSMLCLCLVSLLALYRTYIWMLLLKESS